MTDRSGLDTIGKRLRHARDERGLGSRELARAAGLKSESHVALIEGDRGRVDSGITFALAKVLDISLEWLIGGETELPALEKFRRDEEGHALLPHLDPTEAEAS